MTTWALAALMSLLVSTALTPLVLRFALRRRLLDQPGERKVHAHAIPRLGGVAVAIAVACPLISLAFVDNAIAVALYATPQRAVGFGLGAAAIVALGIYDDLRGANARVKFSVQIAVAVAMWFAGFRIEALGGSVGVQIQLAWLSLPVTVFWIVGVVNAVNLIDGLDGLASGLALIAAVAFFLLGVERGLVLLPLLMAAVAGALVGFLFFNFNPARIFLGDSGSLFLGFVVAMASIWTHLKGPMTATLGLVPLLVLVVPLLDTTLAIVRRVRRGQSPFSPDREHLHHRLMERGLSHRGAVLALYCVALAVAAAGGATLHTSIAVRAAGLTLALAVVIVLVRHVGLFGADPPGAAALLDDVAEVARDVGSARTPTEAWATVQRAFPKLGASGASLNAGDDGAASSQHWGAPAPREDVDEWEDLVLPFRRGDWRGAALVVRWHGRRDPRVRALHRRAVRRLRSAVEVSSALWTMPEPAKPRAARPLRPTTNPGG